MEQTDVTVTFARLDLPLLPPRYSLPAFGYPAPCVVFTKCVARQGERRHAKDGLIRGGLGFEGALIDGRRRGRWETEREGRRPGDHSSSGSIPTIWLVGCGLLPPFHATPLPPSFLSAACYYSEATIFYFFFFCHCMIVIINSLVLTLSRTVWDKGIRKEAGRGEGWSVGAWLLVALRGGRSGPTGRVLPCGFSCLSHVPGGGGASGVQRWLLLNVGERSYRADAVRRRPPGARGVSFGWWWASARATRRGTDYCLSV